MAFYHYTHMSSETIYRVYRPLPMSGISGLLDLYHTFTHVIHSCFTVSYDCPNDSETTFKKVGKIDQASKHNNSQTMHIFL